MNLNDFHRRKSFFLSENGLKAFNKAWEFDITFVLSWLIERPECEKKLFNNISRSKKR